MNYKKHYIKLIRKAQTDPILFDDTYTERHHIFPRSIFGEHKINNNTVKLTAKEHFIAHLLLWKYYQKKVGKDHWKTKKMSAALWYMSNIGKRKLTSRLYLILREESAKLMSEKMTGNIPWNKGSITSQESIKKMIATKKGKYCGENSWSWGKHLSDETKNKISLNRKGKLIRTRSSNVWKSRRTKSKFWSKKKSRDFN